MSQRVAFFDLDNTLIDLNSAKLWVRHEWSNGRVPLGVVLRATYWLARYTLGDDRLEGALEEASKLYAEEEEEALRARVEAWFAEKVKPRLRPGAEAALRAHREAGDRLVIATSSSQFAAACAQAAYGLDDRICTELQIVRGRLTGELEASAYGAQKLERTRAWASRHGVDLARCTFYTDSYTDRSLLAEVGQPVVVHPDRRLAAEARARGWPIVDWGRAP